MPRNGRWAYAICGISASLILLDSRVLGGGVRWPEGEVTRQLDEAARAAIIAFSLLSLFRRFMLVWAVLLCIVGFLLAYEVRVTNTFALSAWLGLACSTLIPFMALCWVHPVRS